MKSSFFCMRFVSACCLAFLLSFAVVHTSYAASPAHQQLEKAIDSILQLIKDPAYANPATRTTQRGKIEKEVQTIFDAAEFSMRTVGQRWRSFTPQQQDAFAKAFSELLITTYVNKIDGYNGEQVQFVNEVTSGGKVEIRTVVALRDGKKIPVAYRMLEKQGKWRVYDVLVENLSLVKNYRTQFQDILTTATPEELIARINEKTTEVRRQHEKK